MPCYFTIPIVPVNPPLFPCFSLHSQAKSTTMRNLNLDEVRSHFPALSGDWVYFDNAGGTQLVRQAGDKMQDYLFNTNVQLGASYGISQQSGARVKEAHSLWSRAINARHESEIVLGSSTTALLQNLSRSLVQQFKAGDEVIVTNSDHEANIGPWLSMARFGIKVKIWKINPDSLLLELDDLKKLMTDKTRLVAFTHTSNILGTINPVKEITRLVHEQGALVCVDGVAFAPHRLVDVRDWDVDFYVFSLYKVYGPHYALLYGKQDLLHELPGINHFFIGKEASPYHLQPGNVNFELTYGSTGIIAYFERIYQTHIEDAAPDLFSRLEKVFDLFANHEAALAAPMLSFLSQKSGVRIIGLPTADKNLRVPTISFTVNNRKSSDIPLLVDPYNIGIRWGDFYARRLIDDLNLSDQDGIVRISMVHYNTMEEVTQLIDILDRVL